MFFLNRAYEKILKSKWALLLSAMVGLVAIILWYYLINQYSVNVLFRDQWGFFQPFFTEASLWEHFNYQHGPHKQGLGMLITALVANGTDWNTRADSFVVGSFMLLTAISFLLLKQKLIGKLNAFDLIILLLCITPIQMGFVVMPNLSHGVLPIFLLSLVCWSLIIKNIYLKYSLFLILDFLLVYTGFGLFMGVIAIGYFIVKLLIEKNESKPVLIGSLLIAIAILASFFINYTFSDAEVVNESPIAFVDYMVFGFTGLSKFWSFRFANMTWYWVAGIITALVAVVIYVKAFNTIRLSAKKDNLSEVILLLSTFTILFIIFMTYGRVNYGVKASLALRYAPLIMPIYLSIYFYSYKLEKGKPFIQFALIIMLLSSVVRPKETAFLEKISNHKKGWLEAFKKTKDVEQSNTISNFMLYRREPRYYKITDQKWEYLKENKLNLFAEE